MEFRIGAGLTCIGIGIAIWQWLIAPEQLSYEIKFSLVLFSLVLFMLGVVLLVRSCWHPQLRQAASSQIQRSSYLLSADQRAHLAQALENHFSPESNASILFANIKHKSFAEMLLAIFQASHWQATMGNVPQEPYRREYLEGIEVSGHNQHFVEAIGQALRDSGLRGVKTGIISLNFGPENPKWNSAQHKVKIMIGHEVTAG